MNPSLDSYFSEGCGRCARHATPACSVRLWQVELETMRQLILVTGLTEERKWSQPVYTWQGKNVVILAAFQDYCCIGFFKGSLLADPENLLVKQGEFSSQSRLLKFTHLSNILDRAEVWQAFIHQAIEIEQAGLKPEKAPLPPFPEELTTLWDHEPEVKVAFLALTPGRQRGYLLHFWDAKRPATRLARIEKCLPKILAGKGFME